MGMNIQKEEQQREQALAREQQRQEEKQAKREALMNTTSYRVMDATAKYMDKYFLDPLLGLIPGGVGDVLTSALALPFIYFAAGYALASEFPELSREELLSRADERMYQEKRQWYTKHRRIR